MSLDLPLTVGVLADNGYCDDWLASLFGKNGGTLFCALRRGKEADAENEGVLRAWHRVYGFESKASSPPWKTSFRSRSPELGQFGA